MWDNDPRGRGFWMAGEDWDKTKGDYAKRVNLDIMFENKVEYAKYFPESCTFIRVPLAGFKSLFDLF